MGGRYAESAVHLHVALAAAPAFEPLPLSQKAVCIMELLRSEISAFSKTSEQLLASTVQPIELTKTERDVIRYYLSAIDEKFPADGSE